MNDLFTWLFVTLLAMAAAHFAYEAIVLPSIRMTRWFKVSALRDRLRKLKIEAGEQVPDAAFGALDQVLSWQLENQHRMTIQMVCEAQRCYERDASFRAEADRRDRLLAECRLPEFTEIRDRAFDEFKAAVAYNSGMLWFYIIPAAIAFVWIIWYGTSVYRKIAILPDQKSDALAASA